MKPAFFLLLAFTLTGFDLLGQTSQVFLDPNNVFKKITYSMGRDGNLLISYGIDQKLVNNDPSFVTFDRLDRSSVKLIFKMNVNSPGSATPIVRNCESTNLPNAASTDAITFLITPREARSPNNINSLNDEDEWRSLEVQMEYRIDNQIKKTEEITIIRNLVPDVGIASPSIKSLTYDRASNTVKATISLGVSGIRVNKVELVEPVNQSAISERIFSGGPQQEQIDVTFGIRANTSLRGNYKVRVRYTDGGAQSRLSPEFSVSVIQPPVPLTLRSGYPKVFVNASTSLPIIDNYYYLSQNNDIVIEAIETTSQDIFWTLLPEYYDKTNGTDPSTINMTKLAIDRTTGRATLPTRNLPDGIYKLKFSGVGAAIKSIPDVTVVKNTRIVMQDLQVDITAEGLFFTFGVDQPGLSASNIYVKNANGTNKHTATAVTGKDKYFTCLFPFDQLQANEKTPNTILGIEFYLNENKFFNFSVTIKSKDIIEAKLLEIVNSLKSNGDIGNPRKYSEMKAVAKELIDSRAVISEVSTTSVSVDPVVNDATKNSLADELIESARSARQGNLASVSAIKQSPKFVSTLKTIGLTALKIFGTIIL